MAEKKVKVLVTESLSGVFGLAHRTGMVHEFEKKRAQEIIDSGRGQWFLPDGKSTKGKEASAQSAKNAPQGETATDPGAAGAEQS